jgi:hypothetical protein
VSAQESLAVGGPTPVNLLADLVLRDADTHRPLVVLDAKYKRDARPQARDLEQILAYAEAHRCAHAALVYPRAGTDGFRGRLPHVAVRALSCDLAGDLEAAADQLTQAVLVMADQARTPRGAPRPPHRLTPTRGRDTTLIRPS